MSIVHFILAMRLPYRGVYHAAPNKSPTRRLQVATEKLDENHIHQLLSSGGDPKPSDHNGDSVLHLAFKRLHNQSDRVQANVIRVLEIYLERGLSVNRKNAAGETILSLAIKYRLENVIKFLIRRGAKFESPDEHGNTTLHFVVENEFDRFSKKCMPNKDAIVVERVFEPEEGFIRWILTNVTSVDYKNLRGYTPLSLAAERNLLHIVLMLLDYTKFVTFTIKEHKTAFHIFLESISQFNNYDQLDRGIPTFCYGKKYVIEIVRSMLDKGYDIDASDVNGNTPILIALKNDQTEIARMMLEYPIKSLEKGKDFSFVQLAVIRKNVKVLLTLKEKGADFSVLYRGNNLLHLLCTSTLSLSAKSSYEAIVDLLVKEGCDVNARNDESMTPLHLASQAGISTVVKRLIEHGANVYTRELSKRRLTPLHQAIDNNNYNVIEVLVNGGADINARTANGQTGLHLAMLYKSSLVQTLLKLGAHVDVQDDEGRPPLYDAICYHNITALKELLKYGADINDNGIYQEIAYLTEAGIVMRSILEYWIKLQAAGLPSDNYYRYQLVDGSFQISYNICLDEADKLKDCLFNDGTSMYELLHMNPNRRCNYLAEKDMKDSLLSSKLEYLFPKYHIIIQACYHEATARYPLLEPAKCAWYELTEINLPQSCVEQILSYVNNMTLRSMAGSLKDRSLRVGNYEFC